MMGRWGRRCKRLMDDVKETRGYWKLKEAALDCTVCRTGFGRGLGPVIIQTVGWMKLILLLIFFFNGSHPVVFNLIEAYIPSITQQVTVSKWLKYKLNTKYITSSRNRTKFYYTVLQNNYMFRPFCRPSSGCVRLALWVMYLDDKYTTLILRSQSSYNFSLIMAGV